jgi:serine/threonine protein kinase
MHSSNSEKFIIHRDLKLENIFVLLNGDEVILKVGDFGFAKYIARGGETMTQLGSPLTMAPEVKKGRYNELCDIYSMGVILY